MEEIFIQNKGMNKTWIHSPGINNIKESEWNMNYDGNKAKIDMNLNDNGFIQNYQLELDNNDLEEILSIPSEPLLLDKRLMNDFNFLKKRKLVLMPKSKSKSKSKSSFTHKKIKKSNHNSHHSNKSIKNFTHLSSPGIRDQFFIPNKTFSTQKSKKKNHTYSLYKTPKKYSRKTF